MIKTSLILSPIFISSSTYGTRSTTVLLIDYDDHAIFMERTFDRDPDKYKSVEYEFLVESY